MKVIYSEHAQIRMKQRGITNQEVEHTLLYPNYVKKTIEGKKEVLGIIRNRTIKVIFIETESYIKVITVR